MAACARDAATAPAAPVNPIIPPAPAGIAAEPGPSVGTITVSWTPVAEAVNYAVYWSTTPGVTSATGVRTAGTTTSFVHANRTPGVTYYYIVAGVGPDLEGPPSAEISGVARDDIALHVETPQAGDKVSESIPMVVVVTSSKPLASFVASVGSVTAPLAFDPSIGRWTGTLSLASLPSPSPRLLTLMATDVQNASASANIRIRYDQPPAVTVTSPDDGATVGASVRLTATCVDDAPAGCASLTAYVEGSANAPLAAGTARIDTTATLGQFAGSVRIVFDGIDTAGQLKRVVRTVTIQQ